MRLEVRKWVQTQKPYFFKPGMSILEIGSRNINGEIRDLFPDAGSYVGVDKEAGEGVDVVLDAHDLVRHFKPHTVDIILCLETLEHDDDYWRTLTEVRLVMKSTGVFVVTVPDLGVPVHCEPDYWRWSRPALRVTLRKAEFGITVCESIPLGVGAVVTWA